VKPQGPPESISLDLFKITKDYITDTSLNFQGLGEVGQHAELGTSFAMSYAGAMFKQIEGFLKVFDQRFQCNSVCKKKDTNEERKACEEQFCKSSDDFIKTKSEKPKKSQDDEEN